MDSIEDNPSPEAQIAAPPRRGLDRDPELLAKRRCAFWLAILITFAILHVSAFDLAYDRVESIEPRGVDVGFSIALAASVLAWCTFDAALRNEVIPGWCRVLTIFTAPIGLLVYLVRTRRTTLGLSLLKLFGVVLAIFFASILLAWAMELAPQAWQSP